jgi:polysaccharide export outer membrane protein
MRSALSAVVLSLLVVAGKGVAQQSSLPDTKRLRAGQDPPVAGDVIRLKIWQEPDLSGDFPVDENGIVVLPRLGRVKVTSETPESLEARLIAEYRKYLTHESIDVTVLRRIQILGAVRSPGVYPLDPTMTIADAVAAAGGATTEGRSRQVELVRSGERVPVELYAEQRLADSPIRSGDQLYVPERSWLSRNAAVAGAIATGVIGLLFAVAR